MVFSRQSPSTTNPAPIRLFNAACTIFTSSALFLPPFPTDFEIERPPTACPGLSDESVSVVTPLPKIFPRSIPKSLSHESCSSPIDRRLSLCAVYAARVKQFGQRINLSPRSLSNSARQGTKLQNCRPFCTLGIPSNIA